MTFSFFRLLRNSCFTLSSSIVMDRRRQRVEREFLDNEKAVQDLNELRKNLENEHIKLQKRKVEHDVLAGKGNDFMVELELGNAPPLDFILRNADIQEEDLKDFDDELMPLEQEIEKVKQKLVSDQNKLFALRVKQVEDEYYFKATLLPYVSFIFLGFLLFTRGSDFRGRA